MLVSLAVQSEAHAALNMPYLAVQAVQLVRPLCVQQPSPPAAGLVHCSAEPVTDSAATPSVALALGAGGHP